MDSARRWVHDARTPEAFKNCIKDDGAWDPDICQDPQTCANNCAVDGVDEASLADTYGVHPIEGGIKMGFVTGSNVGARVYVLDSNEENYKMFRLKNREISFDVDVSSLPCGLNAALYLVQMDASGQKVGDNGAGAKFGTGYCDAQCPHQSKFVQGEANIVGWNPDDQSGHFGACCAEMDLWEANNKATSFTAHPCTGGQTRCEGTDCGDADKQEHYMGLCDKDGCDFNTYRLGSKDFYGPGMTVDSGAPMTVVTQFLTNDGTDGGDLAEIRRFYVQNGKVIDNAKSVEPGIVGASMSDAYCSNQKKAWINTRAKLNPQGEFDQFNAKGGLKAMGASLDAGMVLVLSLWDDPASAMRWLDSDDPQRLPESVPGVVRGPCSKCDGEAKQVESTNAEAFVSYTNIKWGEIGTTYAGLPGGGPAKPEEQPAPVVPPPVAEEPEPAVEPLPASEGQVYGAGVGNTGAEASYGAVAYGAGVAQVGQTQYGQGVYPQKVEVGHDMLPALSLLSLLSLAGPTALVAAGAATIAAFYAVALRRRRSLASADGTHGDETLTAADYGRVAQVLE